jgi:hypothetical protein
MTNSAWATKANVDFSVTPIAENVYSIVSPSFGLPTPENKGWNSNSHFVVTEKGVLLFDTGSSEVIGKEIKRAIKSVTDKPVLWVVNLVDTLGDVIKLDHAIVLTGHGKATTSKSLIRDANLLDGVWQLVKTGYEDDKKSDEILLQVSAMLGPKYRPLYKNFDSQIKLHVKLMYKRQK